ncbi:MAG: phage tail tape measure protein [Lactobacillus sp.]|jgi:TP901 family phage tail tape measure protein|nr:phage tail tape measure protein [Lactobacillus sp.]
MAGNLGHLAATVSLDIDPFQSSARALNATIKSTTAALKAQDQAAKNSGNAMNNMKASYSTMESQMKNYQAQLTRQQATYEKLKGTTADTAAEQEKLTARQANAANQVNRTSANIESLSGRMSGLQKEILVQDSGWTKAGQSMTTFGNVTTKAGQGLSNFGSGMTSKVTMPLLAVGAAAIKTGLDFDAQMSRVQAISGATGGQFTKLRDQAIDLGAKTAFSAKEAATGMENMASAGFNASEIMQAMPGVLDLAAVSGGDVALASDTAASAIRAFGLSASDSTHVANVFAQAAADTNAEVGDMGEAMKYAAPVAHSLGVSMEETAAAIGIMSDAGIKGSQAGTTLRGAFTRLAKPTKDMQAVTEKLGISFFDASGKMKPMGTIIGDLKSSMSGYDKQTQAAMLTTLFGKEALSGMMALVDAGPDKFNKLTGSLKNSDGAADKMAKTMQNNAKSAIEQMMGSLESASIKIESALAPSIKTAANFVGDLADKFSELDPKTQMNIVKFAGLAAAIGPVSKLMGGIIKPIGGVVSGLGGAAMAVGRMSTASKMGGTAMQVLKSGFSKTAFEAMNFGSKAATAGTAAAGMAGGLGSAGAASGGLLAALAPVAPVLIGVGVAAVAGVAIWKLWGEEAYNSSQRTARWGSDVGAHADEALGKMRGFSQDSINSLNQFQAGATTASSSVAKDFRGMYKTIKDEADTANKKLKESLKDLPESVSAGLEKSVARNTKANNELVAQAKTYSQNVTTIMKNASNSNRKLTDDENTYLLNARKTMNNSEVQLLNISGARKKQILAALNGDIKNMTVQARQEATGDLQKAFNKENELYDKQKDKIKDLYKDGKISTTEYKNAISDLAQTHQVKSDQMVKSMYDLMKANGLSKDVMEVAFSQMGLSYSQAMDAVERASQKGEKSVSLLSTAGNKAAAHWNGLIFDPKTGKVKTNAQEEVNKAAGSEKGWKALRYDLKNADLSTNAKEMIGIAALQSGRWDSMAWAEKKAVIRTEGAEDLVKSFEESGKWNQLTLEQKQAIITSKGGPELGQYIVQSGIWNGLTMNEKAAVIRAVGGEKFSEIIARTGVWQDMTLKEQEAVIQGDYTPLVNALIKAGEWNSLTVAEKSAIIHDKATQNIVSALAKTNEWNNLDPEVKNVIVHAQGKAELADIVIKYGLWNDLPQKQKELLLNDADARSKLIAAGLAMDDYNLNKKPETKVFNADNADFMAKVQQGKGGLDTFNQTNPVLKMFQGDATNVIEAAVNGGQNVNSYNELPIPGKIFPGDPSGIVNASNTGKDNINTYNATGIPGKNFPGDPSSIVNASNTGKTNIGSYNSTGIPGKTFPGDPSSVVNASDTGRGSINTFNSTVPDLKHLKGQDDASGPARTAKGAVDNFASGPSVITKWLKTVIQTVKETIGMEEGGSVPTDDPIMVNDQKGSVFREAIIPKKGLPFIPHGRNVYLSGLKGAQVVPANKTKRMFGIMQFASGTGGYGKAAETIQRLPSKTDGAVTTISNQTGSTINQHYEINLTVNGQANENDAKKMAQIVMDEMKKINRNSNVSIGGGVAY